MKCVVVSGKSCSRNYIEEWNSKTFYIVGVDKTHK